MANQRRRTTDSQIAFDALGIKGGLLGPEWLAKIAQLDAPGQTAEDYRVPRGLELRDEIARSWRIAQAGFRDLDTGFASGVDPILLTERFIQVLFRDALGFTSLTRSGPRMLGEHAYPVRFFALDDIVPIVAAPAGIGLDTPLAELGDGHRRRSAFGLLQEFLNANERSLWGLVTDGFSLRIARDNASLTRPAWIEVDLGRIFRESLLSDFAALWLLCHESRFGQVGQPQDACPLEVWREAAREAGTVAREKLRVGFREALEILGQGFVAHPENRSLREALHDGSLHRDRYYGQLLRLVYRLIFLLTVEERRLLHPIRTAREVQDLYAEGYSLGRLRDRAVRRMAHDRHSDLWEAVKIVFRGLAAGEPRLGLPALAGLFALEQCPDLDAARLGNRPLLGALFRLAWLREPGGLVRVNWRDMGPDELGYVYEGLLELKPQISEDGRAFSFADAHESRGHARKLTGSYYTPDELVQLLLDSALDPVITRSVQRHPDRPAEALLELAVVDPACGSGHFLIAAARRLADRVAHLRAAGTPTPEDYQRALRDVVRRCIYGVDLNPLAVELCKVSLWMESIDPGLPLTFLESHIRCGNSLIGATREIMGDKVPDEAWVALEGDDKKLAAMLKKRNKAELAGQRRLYFGPAKEPGGIENAVQAVDLAPDADAQALAQKEALWRELLSSQDYEHAKLVADAWCAAFLWPKEKPGPVLDAAPTTDIWLSLRNKEVPPSRVLVETTRAIAVEYALFHWDLAFPHVFAKGGFDVVLGNPPWEHLEIKEEEFFSNRDPSIANARNASERKKRIAALTVTNVSLWAEWRAAKRMAQGEMHFARASGRFPLCARGRINTYSLFAEHDWQILNPKGRAGFIVPSGIATDDNTKAYFQALIRTRSLRSILEFENKRSFFPDAKGGNVKFALTTLSGRDDPAGKADFLFQGTVLSDLDDPARHFSLTVEDIETINPNTKTCPIFRTKRDASLAISIYKRTGVLWRESNPDGNPWGLYFMQGLFNMASDSALFRTYAELASTGWTLHRNLFKVNGHVMLPLYEAKMASIYNHRGGTYEGAPRGERLHRLPSPSDEDLSNPNFVSIPFYWVSAEEVEAKLDRVWDREWLLGWRDITDARTVARTVITAIIPKTAVGDTFLLAMPSTEARAILCLYANLCSIPLDYAARQKVGGLHLKYNVFKQIPAFPPSNYSCPAFWDLNQSAQSWILPRVLELTYTAWDLQPFAEDCGDSGPPFIWDPERRFQLQCELDAAFFHLYGISGDDADYILDTFPVLRRSEERAYGEFRTKRKILEIYDALDQAARTGRPYLSPLGPPKRAV